MGTDARPADEGRLLQSIYYAYVAGSAVARALPERVSYGLARLFGKLAYRLSKKRLQVARNIARITGENARSPLVQDLVRAAFESYARYWLETFRLVREDSAFFLERFKLRRSEEIDAVMARGKGAIVVVGHLGNWDAAGAWVGASGRRLVTVAEVLRPRRMFEFFVAHRSRLGMTIHAAQKGATDRLVEAVESGAVVAILGDRDLKGTGPEVEFFGERVPFPAGPAVVALRSGVPLLVAGVWGVEYPNGKRGWDGEVSDPIELPEDRGPDAIPYLTQEVAKKLEDFVARRPEEWHVFQPFWPTDRNREP